LLLLVFNVIKYGKQSRAQGATAIGTMGKTLFVTVGTTLFDKLILATSSPEALKWMISQGFRRLVIQYGKGVEPTLAKELTDKLESVEAYRFKPTLSNDMQAADLIISHAGAGTVMEAMTLGKHLVVVINAALMDNHQTELANAMGNLGHLLVVKSPDDLQNMALWNEFVSFSPVPYQGGDEKDFPWIVDNLVGFTTKDN
jgi:beta-1,4-N-acetylglucosaminyltransferase